MLDVVENDPGSRTRRIFVFNGKSKTSVQTTQTASLSLPAGETASLLLLHLCECWSNLLYLKDSFLQQMRL